MVISQNTKTDWVEGRIEFSDLFGLYPLLSYEEVAEQLGIPNPSKLVSIRHNHYWWPDRDADRIAIARIDYDLGKVELATGRFGEYFTLYAFPRTSPSHQRGYFCGQY